MAKKTAAYWKERFEQIEQSQNRQGIQCYAELEQQYRQAQRQIETQIQAWYGRFASNNGITIQEAKKMLTNKELAELKWDINQYIQYGEQNAISGTWIKELENASSRYHISRLEALKLQTQQSIETLFGNQLDSIDTAMKSIYTSGYYHTAYEIQKGVGVAWDFATLDDKTISKVISKPWAVDGKNFSSRIWTNKQKLMNELNTTLTQNIILGQDPQKAIDAIAKKLNTSKSNAGRLVMTEEAFFSSAAQKDCFNELDVEQYEIVATLDSNTSEICQGMDGQHFKMSEWQVGVTAPPFHVNCRTTTVPYFGDEFDLVGERAARGKDGKTYHVPGNMTYKDWEKAMVSGEKSDLQEVKTSGTIKSQDRSNAQKASNPDVQEILNQYPVIEGQHSYLDDIKATNPHYSESKKNGDKYYTYNCQCCVNAYEARRRGYDVTAGKRLLKNDTLPYMTNAKGWANVYEDGVNNLIPCFSRTSEGVRKKVSEQIASWGNGARCIVRVQWRGGGGHVFIGECHDGTVVFLDPQNANLDASDYFGLAKVNQTYVLRTDDKEFSTLIQECCDYIIQGGDK